tara:strand:- start:158 stop:691 length:534 start_codon:yes stop_codon:yes gene_type:complete
VSNILFPESEIRKRYEDFYKIAEQFCDKYNVDQSVIAEFDPSLLYLCVVSIYDDIARYKIYHLKRPEDQRSNSIKRAAYGVKWIMHFSPIVFPQMGHITGAAHPENTDALANAMFAMHFALVNLREYADTPFNLKRSALFEIMYDLLYRNMNSDSMLLYFQVIADLAKTYDIKEILE